MRDHCNRHLSRARTALAAACGVALMLTACDALPEDHQGDVLLELQVTVIDALDSHPSRPIHLGVSWFRDPFHDEAEIELEISGALPATLELPIYKYPPLTELYSGALPTEPQLGVGYLSVWVTDPIEGFVMLAMSQEHWVIYVPEAVPDGSFASKLLHGTPARGFHIYARREFDGESRSACYDRLPAPPSWQEIYEDCGGHSFYDEIFPAPAGNATPFSIELGEAYGGPGVLWHSI